MSVERSSVMWRVVDPVSSESTVVTCAPPVAWGSGGVTDCCEMDALTLRVSCCPAFLALVAEKPCL